MFNKLKFQTRLILLFSAVFLLIIAIVYVFINNYVLNEYRNAVIANALELNGKVSQQIDFYANDLKQLSRNSVTNQQLVSDIRTLDRLPSLTVYDNLFFDRVFESYSAYLVHYSSLNTSNVHIFGRQNRFKFTYGLLPLPSNFEKIMENPAYKERLLKSEVLLYFENENTSPQNASVTASLSVIRPFSDLTGSILGYIEVQQDYKMLEEIARLEGGGEVFVLDENGQFLYPATRLEDDTRQFIESIAKHATNGVLEGSYLYTSQVSAETGFMTVVKHANEAVFTPLHTLQKTTFAMIVGTIMIAMIFVYGIAVGLTKPIRQLRSAVIHSDYENFQLLSNYKSSSNEVNLLHEAFQHLMDRLKQSMDKELAFREEELNARLTALQGQIAPHFIHNVLYLISITAQENKVEEVEDMCRSLSDMLRYMGDSPFKKVTLEKEMQYASNYLYLVQKKYEDFIRFAFTVEEGAKPILLPRLTIQPFIENAIQHAFNEADPPWTIGVSCKGTPQNWELVIEDNGSGMDPDALAALRAQIRHVLDHPVAPKEHITGIGGMGIINTVTRLKIVYQNSLEFDISNNEAGGLRVRIRGSTH